MTVDVSKSVAYVLTSTIDVRFSKATTYVLTGTDGALHSSKVVAYILTGPERPAPDMTIIRAWGCSLDGHDFYLLRVGEDYTLVYDDATGQWAHWSSPDSNVFRPRLGLNWPGFGSVQIANGFNWNITAGDDTTGNIWMMDPEAGDDENIVSGSTSFERKVTGAVPIRGRETGSCHQVFLTMNLGNPQITAADITLETSDDGGQSWYDHGAVTITPSDYNQEIAWYGLGLIKAPGRLFRLTDEGASVRISSLEMR
jgi:hypothetical protein